MPMQPDFPVREMLASRDVVIVVTRARVSSLLDDLERIARQLAPLASVRVHRSNGEEGLRMVAEPGRIRILTAMAARGGRGRSWVTDSVVIDASLGDDERILATTMPMTVTSREPLRALLEV